MDRGKLLPGYNLAHCSGHKSSGEKGDWVLLQGLFNLTCDDRFPTTSHARQGRNHFSQSLWKAAENQSENIKEASSMPALSECEPLQVWDGFACGVQTDGLLSFSLPAPRSPSA